MMGKSLIDLGHLSPGLRRSKSGVDYERNLVRKAWDDGLFALRAAGSGSGTSAYPKPDLLIFRPGGIIDVVQVKTTKRERFRLGPGTWINEVLVANRLKELGFKTRTWLFIRIRGARRAVEVRIRLDGHEDDILIVERGAEESDITFAWKGDEKKAS